MKADSIKHNEIKEIVGTQHKRRVRKLPETKLSGINIIKAVTTWNISLLLYSTSFIVWRKSKLQDLDRKTRKYLLCIVAFTQRATLMVSLKVRKYREIKVDKA